MQRGLFRTSASFAADILSVAAIGAVLMLSFIDHQRSYRPATIPTLYVSMVVILGIARSRTFWLIAPGEPETTLLTTYTALAAVMLVLDLVERNPDLRSIRKLRAPEQFSSFWSRTVFAWLTTTLRTGYVKIVSVQDLPPLDSELESRRLLDRLSSVLNTCKIIPNKPIMWRSSLIISQSTYMSGTPF